MPQPIKKQRKTKVDNPISGFDYCNDCPFLGYQENDVYICSPNDYVFGKVKGNIPVPTWCGNHK